MIISAALGLVGHTLDHGARRVASLLGVELMPRESLYLGGQYYVGNIDGVKIAVRMNIDLLDGDPANTRIPSDALLVTVSGEATNVAPLLERLKNFDDVFDPAPET